MNDATKNLALKNLKSTLEELVTKYNACPTKANLNRIRGVRYEIADLAKNGF